MEAGERAILLLLVGVAVAAVALPVGSALAIADYGRTVGAAETTTGTVVSTFGTVDVADRSPASVAGAQYYYGSDDVHVVRVQYRYSVDGTSYVSQTTKAGNLVRWPGTGIRVDRALGFRTRRVREAQRLARQYRTGRQVTVHYDPRNPSRSYLEPWPPALAWVAGVLGVGAASLTWAPLLAMGWSRVAPAGTDPRSSTVRRTGTGLLVALGGVAAFAFPVHFGITTGKLIATGGMGIVSTITVAIWYTAVDVMVEPVDEGGDSDGETDPGGEAGPGDDPATDPDPGADPVATNEAGGELAAGGDREVHRYEPELESPDAVEVTLLTPEDANFDLYLAHDGREPTGDDHDDHRWCALETETLSVDGRNVDGELAAAVDPGVSEGEYTLRFEEYGSDPD